MESYSFKDLITGIALEDITRIVIPKIQRDYAQGRNGRRATDVRNLFTASLVATLRANDGSRQVLDFIYGYRRDGNFEPLDGQQRLTTLFLLHWLVLPAEERSILASGEERLPVLSYLTRPSARDFCKFLVDIDINHIAATFDKAAEEADRVEKDRRPLSRFISDLDDYRYNWEYDPTVKSMLRMLDALMAQLGTFADIRKFRHENLDNIRFNIRDLEELKQGDELYVKMNARGLELSDFDNTKAALEGDMLAAGVDNGVQSSWRAGMDGSWVDFFWHRAKADNPDNELKVKDIKAIEDDLKTFILRLATLRWSERYYGDESNDYVKRISDMTEQKRTRRNDLSANLTEYLALRFRDSHSETPGICPVIDYASIIEDMNSLLYRKDDITLAADSLAPSVRRYNDSDASFIDSMLGGDFSFGNRLILYGMLEFTRIFKASDIAGSDKLQKDWTTWLRLIRNLSLARNSNMRFDSPEETIKGMEGIRKFIKSFADKTVSEPEYTMSGHIMNSPGIDGFDTSIYEEEKMKENLRRQAEWSDILDRFENEGYLFGQLRAPLQWSDGDIKRFEDYCIVLNRFMTEKYMGALLYVGLLLVSDHTTDRYPLGDSLLTFDNDRDRSFKRYLRETAEGAYAPALRKLADSWLRDYSDRESVGEFLEALIADRRSDISIPLWKRQLAEFPEIIYERSHQRRIQVSENPYLIESKQWIKRWSINLCWLKKTRYKHDYFVIHNTKEENELKDTITGGRLTVADGKSGDRLLPDPRRHPRHRTASKGNMHLR